MNKREKILAGVVGAIIVLFVMNVIVKMVFFGRLTEKEEQIASIESDIDKNRKILETKNKLIQIWRTAGKQALSDDPTKANLLLNERVTSLITESQLKDVIKQPVGVTPEKNGSAVSFYKVAVNLSGKGTLAQIVKFLEMFYQEPYNVKITGFSLKPEGNKSQLMQFSNCRIETIIPAKAELSGILPVTSRPVITGTTPPVKMSPKSQYAGIVDRNIFNMKSPEPPPPIIPQKPVQTVQAPLPPPTQAPVIGPGDPNGRPGDVVGTTVLGQNAGAYVRNQNGVGWYKVSDRLDNQMTVEFVHPLGIVVKDPVGRTLYVEIGRNIDQAAPLTRESLPELHQAFENRKKP